MQWAKLSSQVWTDPKLRRVGAEATCLYLFAVSYATAVESDGFIDESVVNMLSISRKWRFQISKLVDEQLFERDDSSGGWWITNYLKYNPGHSEYAAHKAVLSNRGKLAAAARWEREDASSTTSSNAPSNAKSMPRIEENRIDIKEAKASLAEQEKCTEPQTGLSGHASELDDSPELKVIHNPITPSAANPKARRTRQPRSTTRETTSGPQLRKRDPLFDAMAVACGHDLENLTKSEGTAIGSAVAEVRHQPDITPELIHAKAEAYRSMHPDWELTPRALVKHWSALGQATTPWVDPRQKELADFREKCGIKDTFHEELINHLKASAEKPKLPPGVIPAELFHPNQLEYYKKYMPELEIRYTEATNDASDVPTIDPIVGDPPEPPRQELSKEDWG